MVLLESGPDGRDELGWLYSATGKVERRIVSACPLHCCATAETNTNDSELMQSQVHWRAKGQKGSKNHADWSAFSFFAAPNRSSISFNRAKCIVGGDNLLWTCTVTNVEFLPCLTRHQNFFICIVDQRDGRST